MTSGVNTSNASIKVYDGTTGAYIKDFATGLNGSGDFVFDKSGNLYAVEQFANVNEFSSNGVLLRTFSAGTSTPEGIMLAADGNLLVTNAYAGAYANTVTKINVADGSFSTFATGLGEPIGITAGPDGKYYVANYSFANQYGGTNPDTVQVIDATGGVSSTWNHGGDLSGASYLTWSGGDLFVTSYYNNTVQVFDGATGNSLGGFSVPGGTSGITVWAAVRPRALVDGHGPHRSDHGRRSCAGPPPILPLASAALEGAGHGWTRNVLARMAMAATPDWTGRSDAIGGPGRRMSR